MKYNFLFNFAASYLGGGYKRLYEYARWFNENGGAWFVIHPRCENLMNEFPKNRFFLVTQDKYQRVFGDCAYLSDIRSKIGLPDLYYSYGIPVYNPFGKINWFHLSNVLPICLRGVPLPLIDRLKFLYLGRRIKMNFTNADVISAESKYSLGLIDDKHADKLFLSVNGGDDEINNLSMKKVWMKENIATVLGTYSYKRLRDSFCVFEMLKESNSNLKLIIIGDKNNIPGDMLNKENVMALGLIPREVVVEYLRKTKYYISTTHIENSYNAASEGIFFADESYISDIGPHRELLMNMPFEKILIPNVDRSMLHVKQINLSGLNLKTWEQIIVEMTNHVRINLSKLG